MLRAFSRSIQPIRCIYPYSPLQGQTTRQLITTRVMWLPLPAAFQDRSRTHTYTHIYTHISLH